MSAIGPEVILEQSKTIVKNREIKENKSEKEIFTLNQKDIVLLNIPAGKPNRKQDSPKRVLQPAQKGDTCFYYAVKISAMLEDGYLNQQEQKERKLASEYRKAFSKLSAYEQIKNKLKICLASLPKKLTKSELVSYLTFIINEPSAPFTQEEMTIMVGENSILKKFDQDKEEDFFQFLQCFLSKKRFVLAFEFLTKLGLKPQEELERFVKTCKEKLYSSGNRDITSQLENPKALTPFYKEMILFKVVLYHIERIFSLKQTPWKPFSNIQVLQDLLLQRKSPIVFYGFFGKTFYNKPFNKLSENIEGYQVYGWPKDSHKPKGTFYEAGHTITVIGVRKNNSSQGPTGWIYYIDPADSSAPNQTRIIYKISYEQFCNFCLDGLANTLLNPSDPRHAALEYGRQRLA